MEKFKRFVSILTLPQNVAYIVMLIINAFGADAWWQIYYHHYNKKPGYDFEWMPDWVILSCMVICILTCIMLFIKISKSFEQN